MAVSNTSLTWLHVEVEHHNLLASLEYYHCRTLGVLSNKQVDRREPVHRTAIRDMQTKYNRSPSDTKVGSFPHAPSPISLI